MYRHRLRPCLRGRSDEPAIAKRRPPDGAEDRDVRLAAVRGLAKCRQPESVVALTRVMQKEYGKDGARALGRAVVTLASR